MSWMLAIRERRFFSLKEVAPRLHQVAAQPTGTGLNFGTRYPLFSFFLLDCSYFDVHFNINMVFVLFLLLLALQLLVLDLLHFMERYEDGDKCLMRFQCFGLPYFSYGLVRRTPWHHQLHSRVGACHWVCCCLSLVH